jgi:hypothetical protein
MATDRIPPLAESQTDSLSAANIKSQFFDRLRQTRLARLAQAMQPIWMTVLAAIGLLVLARFANLGAGATAMATPSDAPAVPDENFCAPRMPGQVIAADPSNYQHLLTRLEPGDTLRLEPGIYRRLTIAGLNGAPGACITIAGPIAGPRAKIIGENGYNTVSIERSSYLVLRNLVIDSAGIPGADGIKAPRTQSAATHHIVLDGNLIIGAGANQQTDGISTKTPTWN